LVRTHPPGPAVGKAIVQLEGDSLKCQDQLRLS
jgi:hypothetical protein